MNAAVTPDLFAHPSAEDWLTQRLEQLGHPIETNLSVSLKDRVRAAITTAGIGCVIAGRGPSGKGAEDFEAAFERVFGEPLVPKPVKRARQCG